MIHILLSTFNGEKFLAELLESLKMQTFQDFMIIVRDDGSSDGTLAILETFEKEKAVNMKIIAGKQNIGTVASYNILLKESTADYVMFCDQDDVWMPQKIEQTLSAMQNAEVTSKADEPIMVFSDLKVVDKNLKLLSESFFKYMQLNPERLALPQLLVQNIPCACTMLLNRSLLNLVKKIPEEAVMHDHWFSLVTAAFGKFVFLDNAAILYRQHDNNIFGAASYGWSYLYKKYRSGIDNLRTRFYLNAVQARAFRMHYEKNLPSETLKLLEEFADISQNNWFERRKILFKHKIYKSNCSRNIGIMLII